MDEPEFRNHPHSLGFAVVRGSVSHSREKDKHFGKFGDLHVTTTELESFECASHRGDHHHVAVFVKVENAGKGVICII